MIFFGSVSVGWLLLFAIAIILMQTTPPRPDIWSNLGVGAVGVAGAGLFGWCALNVRRPTAYLEGTTLRYHGGFGFSVRYADLARVTEARIGEDTRYGGYDLLLTGSGNLKKIPLSHPSTGVLPELSREILATALAANPNKTITAEAIEALRSSFSEPE
jgi:hypothetical protein